MFGAYTHCIWANGDRGVADPSGKSFLFSLVNDVGRAVRFPLRNNKVAVALPSGGGVHFGLNGTNFALNFQGAATDDDRGNTAGSLSKNSSYLPDRTIVCGIDVFAGSEFFAAADIEVFEF